MALELWTEKFRPSTLDEYVWVDPTMRSQVEEWLHQGALPHCLFSGLQGTGKTSLAKLLFRELNIPAGDLLFINASRERQIDAFQNRIINFVDAWPLGPSGIKYILLDEADKMSKLAQGLLRNEMETYSDTCRFVLTANYPGRITPEIHSRVIELRFPSLDKDAFTMRLAEVLEGSKVVYDAETLVAYVEVHYPDLRKCIGVAQQNSRDGKLWPLRNDEKATQDYLLNALELFRKGKFLDARKLIIAQIQPDEYDDFYRLLYQNLALFGRDQREQDEALQVIRRALIAHATISDPEINLAGALVELAQIIQSN